MFLNAALALEGKRQGPNKEQQQIAKLEQKIRQKDEVLAELMAEHVALKKARLLGGAGYPRRGRGLDSQMGEQNRLRHRALVAVVGAQRRQVLRLGAAVRQIQPAQRQVPRDFWLTEDEKKAILDFQALYPQEGYRRLTYMMMDADVVAVSPSSVFRVLHDAGRLGYFPRKDTRRGPGSSSHWGRMSTGTSISPTSISTVRSTTCARSWTGLAATSWIGV